MMRGPTQTFARSQASLQDQRGSLQAPPHISKCCITLHLGFSVTTRRKGGLLPSDHIGASACAHNTAGPSPLAAALVVAARLIHVCPLLEAASEQHGEEVSGRNAWMCGPGAQVAPLWTLARVDAQADRQAANVVEGLAAAAALVRAFACVRAQVVLQAARVQCHIAALLAAEQPVTWYVAALLPVAVQGGACNRERGNVQCPSSKKQGGQRKRKEEDASPLE